MTDEALTWLPLGVTTRDAVQAAIGRAVADWSALWFPRPQVSVSGFKPTLGEPRDDADGSGWRVYRKTVAISCPRRSASRLAGWALDAPLAELSPRKADRRLLELFERTLIEDLAHKVELALGVEAPAPSQVHAQPQVVRNPFGKLGGAAVTLTEDFGAPLLALAIPLAALLPLCRSSLAPAPRKPAALASFAAALGSADLTIEATLGNAEVPVADLRTLAPGDVLVLQRGLADAVDVSLAGSETTFARAKLIDLDGQMALALQT